MFTIDWRGKVWHFPSLFVNREVKGDSWTGQDFLFYSHNKTEQDPEEIFNVQGVHDKYSNLEDKLNGDESKQKRMKCESTDDGFGLLESLRSPEKTQTKSSDQDDFSPSGHDENWKSEIREWGGGRIQAKKSKSRMKLPEEWSNPDNTSTSPPFDTDIHENKTYSSLWVDQEAASLTALNQSVQVSKLNPSLNNQTLASLSMSPMSHETLAASIELPAPYTTPCPNISVLTEPSTSASSSPVASKIPADPVSLTSLKEPSLAKTLQGW